METWTADSEVRLLELLRAQNGAESFDDFVRRVSPRLPPPAHLAPLRRLIEDTRHREVRALVSMPPRFGKSITLLHGLAWRVQNDPACLNAYVSYGDSLSLTQSRKARRYAEQAGVELATDSNAISEWRTRFDGGLVATGVGGPLTGKGITGGILVIDDPLKNREQAESATVRDKVIEWFGDVAYNRLESGASVIVCATRWHQSDLIGHIASELGADWEIISLPAVSDADGKAVDERLTSNAKSLWPELFPLSRLAKIRETMGEYGWWSVFQQQPRPRGEALFGEPSRFDLGAFNMKGFRVAIACDPAASEKTHADYSVCVTAAMRGHGDDAEMYILDVKRWQVQVPVLVTKMLELQRSSPWAKGAPILVEAVGGFKAVPQMLRQAAPQLRIEEIEPRGDKFTRAQPFATLWNRGKVHVPSEAPWVKTFLDEIQAFTGVSDPHDDQVDAAVHSYTALAHILAGKERFRALI